MPVSIRAATLEDIPSILVVEQAAATAAHWTADQYKDRVESGGLLVAESERRVCGFLCARAAAGEWELENIVVATASLRGGVADSLMRIFIQRAQQADASDLLLEVRESNVAARRLYEKHGFRDAGRRPHYYQNPADDAILYTLSLRRQGGPSPR